MNRAVSFRLPVALTSGLIFGFGLSLSGMIDPARVLGFLDIASRHWDPSLIFVLGGAVAVAVPGVILQRKIARPVLDDCFHLPAKTAIDGHLIFGSMIFWRRVGAGRLLSGTGRHRPRHGARADPALRRGDGHRHDPS